MLVNAVLNAHPNGGEIVYTTRTLNPVHNEFMVQFAIETLRHDHNVIVEPVKTDLEVLKQAFSDRFEFETRLPSCPHDFQKLGTTLYLQAEKNGRNFRF